MSEITEPTTDQVDIDQPQAETGTQTVQSRQMIKLADLTAHPGNVREDLRLSAEFTASVAAEGVRVPLLVTAAPDGGWRVIEGHRRLAAAVQAGLDEVPCDIDPARADDEAGQYLDMALANSSTYRVNYEAGEEAAALFAAHEAGASRTRIRKATGQNAAQVKAALAAGSLPAMTRAEAARRNGEVTLHELAVLAEFDGDEQATQTLLSCLELGGSLEHVAERIRQDRVAKAERDQLRASLIEAGVPLTERMPEGGSWLSDLICDGEEITPEAHASCPGHGAAFADWNPLHPMFYCTSPAEHGHVSRRARLAPAGGSHQDSDDDGGGTAPGAGTPPAPAADPSRALVITANRAWEAAAQVRHRWLAASMFSRRSLPREAQAFAARQLLSVPDPLRGGLIHARHSALFAKLTGHDAGQLDRECDTATAGRLTVLMLAPIVIAYERALTEGEGRNTWRTDRYSPCARRDAATYLNFLAGLGYQLSDIEQAVADGSRYTGDSPADGLLDADGQPADAGSSDSPDSDPGSAGDLAAATRAGDPSELSAAA